GGGGAAGAALPGGPEPVPLGPPARPGGGVPPPFFAGGGPPPPAPPLEGQEIAATVSCVVLNTAVTLAGLALWRTGVIRFRTDVGLWAWFDAVALLMIMDLAMYVLHRLGHHPWLFPLLHRMHHTYDRPRPL